MRGQRFLGMLLICLCFSSRVTLAQVTASIAGTVEDTSGAVIPGATVTARNLESGAARTVATDAQGYYRALSLPVGRYEVMAGKTGFQALVRTGIDLLVGQEAVVNFSLVVGQVQQEVTVTAEAPIVNTTTASTAGLVGEREVKDLPLNGRSFDNLITLNPGATNPSALRIGSATSAHGAEFNISGRRGTDNLFLMDGIEYTGVTTVGTSPGGVSGQLLGIDAVREFNVQANTYGAEYGKRAGGQISIVTMSGGNQFHGTAFEFLRNSDLDARNFFDIQRPAFRRNDFGASAGGPIRKDRSFVFGNYEGNRQALTSTYVAFVPDNNARQGLLPVGPGGALSDVLAPGMAPYLALWPAPNGPSLGGGVAESFNTAVVPVREDFGILRLDQIFSEKDSLSGSYTVDDSVITIPQANVFSEGVATLRAQVVGLGEIHTFSPSVINTARIGYSRGAFIGDGRPSVSLPPGISMIAGKPMGIVTVGGGQQSAASSLSVFNGTGNADKVRNLFTYTDSAQIIKGKHLVNLGVWFQRQRYNYLNLSSAYGSATFADLQSLLQGKAASFVGGASLPGSAGEDWIYCREWLGAWYVTDTIKVLPNFTMSLGLRHEFTNGWNYNRPVQANYLFDSNHVLQTQALIGTSMFTQNNAKRLFAPRIGLAWDPFGNGRTSIHAGFGTYYNLMDDLGYIVPQPSYFQTAAVQFPLQVNPAQGLPPAGTPKPRGIQPDAKTAAVQQWSFLIEQQITPSTALSIAYVGSHGSSFLGNSDVNPTRSIICPDSPCPADIPAGTRYFPAGAPRLNPNLAGANTHQSNIKTSYNSLQVDFKHRLSRGLTLRSNYSYSKALDDGTELNSNFFTNCPNHVMDVYRPMRDWSPACFDITHRLSFNGSYELPMGEGKAFLGGLRGAANKLLGGWKVNGILSVQNGFPFTPIVGFNNSRDADSNISERPSVNPNFSGPVILGTPNKWFNPNAFILPPAGTLGDLGRNTLRGAGLTELDASLFKDTSLGEKLTLGFRAEIFNILNHANFGAPSSSVFTSRGAIVGSAGVVSNTLTTSRQIQLALKLIW